MSIFDLFRDFFFKDTPERQKKKRLQKELKILKSSTPPVIEGNNEILSKYFIQLLFDAFHPLVGFFQLLKLELKDKKGMPLRRYIIDNRLTEQQITILESLEEDSIRKEIKDFDKKTYYAVVEERLLDYHNGFSEKVKGEIKFIYNQLNALGRITEIDFIHFFKEFDSEYRAESANYKAKPRSRDGKAFLDDFKIFDKILKSIEFDENLAYAMNQFMTFKGREGFDKKKIKEVFKNLNKLKANSLLSHLIHYLSQDFNYVTDFTESDISILKPDLDRLIEDKKNLIEKCYSGILISNITKMKDQLFRGESGPSLNYYVNTHLERYSHIDVQLYKYTAHLQFIKSYLVIRYKSVGELMNNIILKGKFNDSDIEKDLGDTYHKLNDLLVKVKVFDEDLSEGKDIGQKFKRLFLSIAKDNNAVMLINDTVAEIDNQAKEIIHDVIVQVKLLMGNIEQITNSFDERSKRILVNITNFDGNKTAYLIDRCRAAKDDMILMLSILKLIN